MKRREFMFAAGAAAAFPKLTVAKAETTAPGRAAPYLELEKFLEPGSDEFPEEKTAWDLVRALHAALSTRRLPVAKSFRGESICPAAYTNLAADLSESVFVPGNREIGWSEWLDSLGIIQRAQFHALPDDVVVFEVNSTKDGRIRHTTGRWNLRFEGGEIVELHPIEQQTATAGEPFFRDITEAVFRNISTLRLQLSKGIPYWRSRLDPATGIDLYGSNGIAVGDVDADGVDEIYVCQPGGIPNRLLKFQNDGTLTDVSEQWNAHMLDDTSAALFLDLRNSGRQDLVVLRSSGPVLLVNEQKQFRIRTDAFEFKTAPRGGFTGMASADYDRDGKLDLYLCCYVYFQSEAQYTYAAPYHDARNGPPNFLFRNELNDDGSGFFVDVTADTGLNENNDRFSFAPAWCDFNDDGWPDLYVANDFGRKNLYVNRNGHFHDEAAQRKADDVGPGMSAAWFDANHDQQPDIYVANMWTAAGQRVIRNANFVPSHTPEARAAYLGHTMGNSLLEQSVEGNFRDVSSQEHVAFGRWAWAAGGHDLDNDGNPEIFVTCGMLTNENPEKPDLSSFFWRQVVNKSPLTAEASNAYQNAWNALNQFIREDYSWNGNEPNVLHAKRGDRYYDFSGVSGLDFSDDSRAFAVLDFDNDGRPDLILKSRLGPQVRVLQNNCSGTNHSIAFRLYGTESNRDAIGARVEVDGQTKWLAAGSEFLSQHSKRMLFGLGSKTEARKVHIKWPSGRSQVLTNLSAGKTYFITEGSKAVKAEEFDAPHAMAAAQTKKDNSLALADTWFLEPVPLPEVHKGPGLLKLDFTKDTDKRAQYEIFRRYLFDWRAPLEPQLLLLLNGDGHAVKIYSASPSDAEVKADIASLQLPAMDRAIPFPGYYVAPRYRDFFKFGAAFLWAGYYAQALPYLEQVLQRTPKNVRTLLLAAQVADELNLAAKTEDFYRRAVDSDPSSAEANNGLGQALGKRGASADARKYLERAIELRRDYSDAINNLGVLFTQQGQLNDAIAAFKYGIRVSPDEDILYLNLGRAYIQSGKLDRAREVMQQLLDRKPDSKIAKRALRDLAGKN